MTEKRFTVITYNTNTGKMIEEVGFDLIGSFHSYLDLVEGTDEYKKGKIDYRYHDSKGQI